MLHAGYLTSQGKVRVMSLSLSDFTSYAAQASDVEVVMGFQGNGSMLTIKCMADHVFAQGFPKLSELIETYLEAGGKLYVCGPCVGSRQVNEDELLGGATIVGAATFVSESLSATQSLIY